MTSQEMVEEYREELLRLTANNKAQINLLTILAEDYKAAAPELVRCIEQVLAECPASNKIILLYVIDSIVKNIPNVANYKELLTKNIVKTFTHVFQESDERQRVSLYKLRNTWNDVFPKSRLYAIDTKINAIDKNWPVAPVKRQITPAVEGATKRPFMAPAQVPPPVPQPTLKRTMALGSHAFVTTPAQTHPSFAVPPPPVSWPPLIEDKTTRLSGVPLNNRIFVEGRAYEVFYLENVAVIERNGVPHRVSFNGPPRDIIIDGVAHKMSFGEQKTVIIEGEAHTLRFGAPSRELYMGNFPFRGVFGGPPIVASINGRRHEIRLGGPPPEVKIEQDPAYELMRHMPTARQQSAAPPVKPVEPKKETLDVLGLLNKLKQTGVLNTVTEAARGDVENLRSKNIRPQKAQSPPIPCSHRLDKFEKKAAPMSSLDQFSMRSLIYRYDTVVDAIHEQRICCPHCGIGFKEKHGEAYKRHIDWHLQSLAKRDYNRCRPWFMTQNWFVFSETEAVNSTVSQDAKDAAKTSNDTKDVCSEGVGLKECSACKEKFEEYWDDDSDSWRFRNSIEENGTLLHRTCVNEKPESKD